MRNPLGRRALAVGSALFISAITLSACTTVSDTGDTGNGSGDAGPVPGVTEDTITLGNLLALTGTFAAGAQLSLIHI